MSCSTATPYIGGRYTPHKPAPIAPIIDAAAIATAIVDAQNCVGAHEPSARQIATAVMNSINASSTRTSADEFLKGTELC